MRAFSTLMAATALLFTGASLMGSGCGGTAVIDPDDGGGGEGGTGTGTSTGAGTGTGTGTGTGAGTGAGTGTGTGTGTGAGTGTGTGMTGDCFDEPTGQQCAECLVMENMEGYQAYVDALYDNCVCGECAMACQMECVNPEPFQQPLSPPCENCFNNATQDQNGPCIQGFQNDCGANPACIDFISDLQNCPF
jgi:hypothetical protein